MLKGREDMRITVFGAAGNVGSRVVAEALHRGHEVTGVDWAYLSPPALLEPGERTGVYRTGTDTLLVDGSGRSAISMEDFAVALLDEADHPVHHRTRFTVAW